MVITVPGRFDGANAYLDLETVKVPTGGFVMKNGEALKNRWSVAMAGVAMNGEIAIFEGAERNLLGALGSDLAWADRVVYSATREFDEMICRGRFTNARRAHEPEPFFPAVPGSGDFRWRNVRHLEPLSAFVRGGDVPSRDVPAALARGDRWVVRVHLLRDVAELILLAGAPDSECRTWCERILVDYDFAVAALADR